MAAESDEPTSDWEGAKQLNDEVRMTFSDPEEGTPAYDALMANKNHTVTQVDKHLKRHIKRVKKKHLLGSRKKEARKDRANIKGKVIDGQHEQYILTMGMMMGIRVSVNRTQQDTSPLLVRDFGKVDKLVFPPRGSTRPGRITPAHNLTHTFKFKDYAPRAFGALRTMFGVDPGSYMNSVCGAFNFIQFIANSRSGQFFFYSHDGQFMIKTQTKQENKFLRRILPHYYRHMVDNPDSMICRFYGMHRVKMYHLRRKLHFVVMRSVVDTACKIHTMYDLKGSLKGRVASKKDRESGGVLKDQDLLSDGMKFELGDRRGAAFVEQLRLDAAFLSELKIMDYSLLVGIHDRTKRDPHHHYDSIAVEPAANQRSADVDGAEPPPPLPPSSAGGTAGSSSEGGVKKNGGESAASPSSTGKEAAGAGSKQAAKGAAAASGGGGGGGGGASRGKSSGGSKSVKVDATSSSLAEGTASSSTSPSPPSQRRMSDPTAVTAHQQNLSKEGGGGGDDQGEGGGVDTVGKLTPRQKSFTEGTATAGAHNGRVKGMAGGGAAGHHHRHSDTPLLRAKERLNQFHGGAHDAHHHPPPAPPSYFSGAPVTPVPPPAPVTSPADAGGNGNGTSWAKSASLTDEDEEYDDSEEDMSSDSDDDDDDDRDSTGSHHWPRNPFSSHKELTGDLDGLPAKPLGELDDQVRVPSFDSTRASALTSRRDGGMNSRRLGPSPHSHSSSGGGGEKTAEGVGGGGEVQPGGQEKGDFIYFVGIIDILQQYNSSKRAETFLKSFSSDVSQISCVPPDTYALRFVNFLKEATAGGGAPVAPGTRDSNFALTDQNKDGTAEAQSPPPSSPSNGQSKGAGETTKSSTDPGGSS